MPSKLRFVPRTISFCLVPLFAFALATGAACSSATTTATLADHESDASSGAPGVASSTGWCQVERVLANKCQRCHGTPQQHGAPFALVTYADALVQDKRGKPRYLALQQAVESAMMPPTYLDIEPPAEPLTDEEKRRLLDWCAAGAPGPDSDAACPGE